jgi:ribosomal-protein-alanine N-acetyltransferase
MAGVALDDAPLIRVGNYSLTLPGPSAAESLSSYLVRNRSRFAPIMPARPDAFWTAQACADRLAAALEDFRRGTGLSLMLLEGAGDSAEVVGDITYSNIVHGPLQACNIGFKIDARLEGIGLMYSALTAANAFVFEHFGLHRISANYIPTNTRSANLLKRADFVIEGYARDYLMLEGVWKDHILTSLVNKAWTPRPPLR